MVPVTIDGEPVKLATITYKPEGNGPFPVLTFHHGSTGRGTNPASFAAPYEPKALAGWFKARGWAVVLPSRRGRGGSEGLYDEGFFTNRDLGYTCEQERSLAGADRALRDIDAATAAILAMPFVDRSRFVVGGLSRGGILSVAWSGRRPDEPRAVINFVGGWLGTGCSTASFVNQSLFKRGVAWSHPSIWLYGEDDPFYPLSHSRQNFSVFQARRRQGLVPRVQAAARPQWPSDQRGARLVGGRDGGLPRRTRPAGQGQLIACNLPTPPHVPR